MNKSIEVFKNETGWNADFIGDAEVFAAFGSSVLPLPFTVRASADTVLADVVARNPGVSVTLRAQGI